MALQPAPRRTAALVLAAAAILPALVLGLQAAGGGGGGGLEFRQRAERGDLRRTEKPLIVDNER